MPTAETTDCTFAEVPHGRVFVWDSKHYVCLTVPYTRDQKEGLREHAGRIAICLPEWPEWKETTRNAVEFTHLPLDTRVGLTSDPPLYPSPPRKEQG